MKRFSPAAIGLIAIIAFVILVDAVIVVVPAAMADPKPSVTASPSATTVASPAELAYASPTAQATPAPTPDPIEDEPAVATFLPAGPSATALPAPTSATPDPATPAPYRDTVWNARTYVKNRIGAKQYDCINAIWTAESKWNPRASNGNGAYGIPQAYPGSKMAAFGSNWRYSPLTQVKWGLWYVTNRYGSACAAFDFWQGSGWY